MTNHQFAVLFMVGALLCSTTMGQTPIPILDGDFEQTLGPWTPFGLALPDEANAGTVGLTNDPGVGSQSLKMFGNFPDPPILNFSGVFQDIAVDGVNVSQGDLIQLDGWTITLSNDSIVPTFNDAFLSITYVADGTGADPAGTEFGFAQARSENTATLGEDEWFRVFTTGTFVPDDAASIRVKAVFAQSEFVESGAAWFDNLSLNIIPDTSGLSCDFDTTGGCDILDLDLLYDQFGTANMAMDLDGNGTIGDGDISAWLAAASDANNPSNAGPYTFVLGDVNLDGQVGSIDLGLLLNNFNDDTGLRFGAGNLNDDAFVNSLDLGILLNNFNHMSLSAATVPEPNAIALLVLGFAGTFCRRIRRSSTSI